MSMGSYRRDDCRLCGSNSIEIVLSLAPSPVGDQYVTHDRVGEPQEVYPMDMGLCRNCGYTGLVDVVDPQILFPNSTEVTSISLGLVTHLEEFADTTMADAAPEPGSLAVDIGSNDGTLLGFYRNQGMRIQGVDAALGIASDANKSGIPTIPGFFGLEAAQKITQESGKASIVCANRVLANIDDMTDVAIGIKELLAPDGVFYFETGYSVDIFEKKLLDTIYHEHLGYDSTRPLRTYFQKHGMELLDIQHIPLKNGSLRGTVQLAGGPRKVKASVQEMVDFEDSQGLNTVKFYQAFAQMINEEKTRFHDVVSELFAQGKTFAGYGASVGATTLIHHFEMGGTLGFLVDDDPRNQGLFSPNFNLPVLASDAIYDRNPEYIVILAWPYAAPIVSKHQKFLDSGGQFIVPLPTAGIYQPVSQGS